MGTRVDGTQAWLVNDEFQVIGYVTPDARELGLDGNPLAGEYVPVGPGSQEVEFAALQGSPFDHGLLAEALNERILSSIIGEPMGVAPLGSDSMIPASYLPAAVTGGLEPIDVWNATTNTPTIPPASAANQGDYYIVNVAGSTNINGITTWNVGDTVINLNGTAWSRIAATDLVSSVAGRTGAVVLTKTDVGLSNVDNTSNATERAATATLTNKTISGASNTLSAIPEASVTGLAATLLAKLGQATTDPPTGGADTEMRVGTIKPDRGTLFLRSGGVWSALDNSYTNWTDRPAAASYPGRVIFIDEVDEAFWSDGTNWLPSSGRVKKSSTPGTTHTGVITESANLAGLPAIPAGLVIVGCVVNLFSFYTMSGVAGSRTWRNKLGSGAANTLGQLAAGLTTLVLRPGSGLSILSVAGPHPSLAVGSNDTLYAQHGGSTTAAASITADFTAAVTPNFTMTLANAADISTNRHFFWEVVFP